MDKYDVVIVGSGIGGLCCGSILALSGKKVLICEAHTQPGVLLTVSKEKVILSNQVLHCGVE